MKAICPKNPDHKRFITVANVMEEWFVDENGDYVDTYTHIQTDHGPDPGNTWTCAVCGAEAKVED